MKIEDCPPLSEVQPSPETPKNQSVVVSGLLMERYNREELYEDVWRTPKKHLTAKWRVSDSELSRICRKMHIPVPEPGYWNKPQERRSLRPPLPSVQVDPRYLTRKGLYSEEHALKSRVNRHSPNPISTPNSEGPAVDRTSHVGCKQVPFGIESISSVIAGEVDSNSGNNQRPFKEENLRIEADITEQSDLVDARAVASSNGCPQVLLGSEVGTASTGNGVQVGRSVETNSAAVLLPKPEDPEDKLYVRESLASRYDRERLYREVWSVPMRKLCKLYGVSDVALAKTCRRLYVPLPGLGYWAIVDAGKPTPPRPSLPCVEIIGKLTSKLP